MEANNVVNRGVRYARESPGAAVVAAFAGILAIDLLLKLAGVAAGPLGGSIPVTRVIGYVWNGVVIGLAGIGLSLTYSILNFANFAHGDYLTAGAFSGWAATYIVAGLGGALAVSALGLSTWSVSAGIGLF